MKSGNYAEITYEVACYIHMNTSHKPSTRIESRCVYRKTTVILALGTGCVHPSCSA